MRKGGIAVMGNAGGAYTPKRTLKHLLEYFNKKINVPRHISNSIEIELQLIKEKRSMLSASERKKFVELYGNLYKHKDDEDE